MKRDSPEVNKLNFTQTKEEKTSTN